MARADSMEASPYHGLATVELGDGTHSHAAEIVPGPGAVVFTVNRRKRGRFSVPTGVPPPSNCPRTSSGVHSRPGLAIAMGGVCPDK